MEIRRLEKERDPSMGPRHEGRGERRHWRSSAAWCACLQWGHGTKAVENADDGWILRVSDLKLFSLGARTVNIDFSARCRNFVGFQTDFALTPALSDLLAEVKRGDYLRVSGAFISHDAGNNPPERAMNSAQSRHDATSPP